MYYVLRTNLSIYIYIYLDIHADAMSCSHCFLCPCVYTLGVYIYLYILNAEKKTPLELPHFRKLEDFTRSFPADEMQ